MGTLSCGTGWGKNIYQLIKIPIIKPCKGYYLRWYYNGFHYWFFLQGNIIETTEGENYRTIGTKKIGMGSGQITPGQCKAIRTILISRQISLLTDVGWMSIRIEPSSVVVYDNQVGGMEIEFVAIIGSKEPSITGFTPVPGDGVISEVILPAPVVTYCEVIIGTQVWMCKNYDINYPGSKVYDNDEDYRAVFGGLYTYNQIMSPGFCPAGWHVPSSTEWQTLINFVGNNASAGGILKEVGFVHWDAPNTSAADTHGLSVLGAGYGLPTGIFQAMFQRAYFWTSTMNHPISPDFLAFYYDYAFVALFDASAAYYMSVRLIKDTTYPLVDIDGNIYTTVTIGTQEWMVGNLKTTHFADGTVIPNITDGVLWAADVSGAMCWYNNDISNKTPYGAMYNWYAVDNIRGLAYLERGGVLEAGWRVPSDADWATLSTFLGGDAIAGGKLKEIGLTHWTPNVGATDERGFKLVGAGIRSGGLYFSIKTDTYLWSTDEFNVTDANEVAVSAADIIITSNTNAKESGCSIRLVRDV